MKFKLLAVGRKMPAWVTAGYQEYANRLPRHCPLLLQEIEPGLRAHGSDPGRAKREESERLLKAIPANSWVVALDGRGKSWSTEQLAEQWEKWQQSGRDIVFLIGGPEGLDPASLSRADQKWSLGSLTFPHPLVRVMLAEQLYRAWSILSNHPYHRG
jgi:23S rRNA (pseudouridine1915-N3)-methyltransferase